MLVQYLNKQSEWNVFEAGFHNVSKSLIGGVAYIQSNCPTSESSFCNGWYRILMYQNGYHLNFYKKWHLYSLSNLAKKNKNWVN